MIVVGAGIIGLSCAWRIAQRGAHVKIFDAQRAAGEASWAGAGMLAPGGEMDSPSELTAMALRSLQLYPDFVAELDHASGVPVDYRPCGAIEIARDEAEADAMQTRAARQKAVGIPSESLVYGDALAARFYPQDSVVDPRDVTAALRIACERLGVDLHEYEPVTAVLPNGKGVRTAHGEYRDDAVLIAAGAWSSVLHPGLPATEPVRGHLIAYRQQPGLLEPILRNGHYYVVQRRSGLVVAGSSTEHVGFKREIDEGIIEQLQLRASELLPVLSQQKPVDRWNGFRPAIAGCMPAIGHIDKLNLWVAFGHYRNGILLAPETARMIADAFTSSAKTDWSGLSGNR